MVAPTSPPPPVADPAVPATPAVPAGAASSEWTLTKAITIMGGVLTVLFGALSQLDQLIPGGSKEASYVAGALSITTALLTVVKGLGYTSSRTQVKVAQANADAAASNATAAQAANPLIP
jgi:hypothetical protein